MLIDKKILELYESASRMRGTHTSCLLFENDDGFIDFESDYDPNWYQEEMAPQMPAGEMAPQMPAGEMAPQIDEDELTAIQISQTQEVFTKIYLVKRLDKIKKYLDNLIDLMELKYDIDEFDQLKRIAMYIDILDEIALILPADTLFHIIAGFEFELLELIERIRNIVSEVPEFHLEETS